MRFFRGLMALACRLFFRKIEVAGQENIPMDKPVIFTPNHQNAFLDAILTGVFAVRQPYYLARGDIFQAKWAGYLLRSIHIWPVFRAKDGLNQLSKNQAIFDSVGELLKQQASVVIFPEANHQMGYQLLPVRKGFARIALATEAETNFELDAQIVPVALHYEAHPILDRKVHVQFGKPISTQAYQDLHKQHPQKALNAFRKDLDASMRSMMADWDREDERPFFFEMQLLRGDFAEREKLSPTELLAWDKDFVNELEEAELDSMHMEFQELNKQAAALKLASWDWIALFYQKPISPLRLLLTALPLLYAWLNHLPFLTIVKRITGLFSDHAFHASLKLVAGVFILPLTYLFQTLLVSVIFGWHPWGWAYLLSLPVSGLLMLRNARYWQLFLRKRKLKREQRKQPELWEKFWKQVATLQKHAVSDAHKVDPS